MNQILTFTIKLLIVFYKKSISPLLPRSCRYSPTCSQYSLDVINKFGLLKGLKLSFKRILSCHPWGGHGHDPIP
ncbi:MAG: membrane protein insertion efficiency factor YidD [Flavobacteriales bacterium]|jgi:putative membrane protein insertion efficiency factor|nr:membrane protein insertion efficiency factor YidD [Flavobacteriales bacterium]MDG1426807.1 membrane protein insertion efficiency factor YidD [Flavobacteriales bacterium]MDG1934015.1 membrane protein insertion efficiency factor YidD [Flavobacteriales bacterium]MDG2086867.1 membrane protein insertion efficiency factor YidD [Flavobacteriales bacterium]